MNYWKTLFKHSLMYLIRQNITTVFLITGLIFGNKALAQHDDHGSKSQNNEEDYYKIITVPIPKDIKLEVSGMARVPGNKMALATRKGDIWILENAGAKSMQKPKFNLFASGLHTPLGLAFKDGAFYAAQRSELTKITDGNGDGTADGFEAIASWPLSGNYCEYNHGPIISRDGHFYINFNLADNGWYTREPFYGEMGSHADWRGWMVQVDQTGNITPFAAGLRSPAGIGMNATGEVFYTENQGGWIGTGYLAHVKKGDFFGHPSSLKSAKLPRSTVQIDTSMIPKDKPLLHEMEKKLPGFRMPSVRFPHGILGTSLAGFVPDTTGGKFGPFKNQLFVGDEGQAKIMRVSLEKIDGEYQGAVFPFREGFESGILRLEWEDNGSLYVGMSDRGWHSIGPKRYGLQKLVWTGKLPFEIHNIKAKSDGFELEFTQPIDRQTAENRDNYIITSFDYAYQQKYGSDVYDKKEAKIKAIKVSDDNRKVRLVLYEMRKGFIYEVKPKGIKSDQAATLLHDFGFYSLNNVPIGENLPLDGNSVINFEVMDAKKKADSLKALRTVQKKKSAAKKSNGTSKLKKNQNSLPTNWKSGPDVTISIGVKPGLKYNIENFSVKPNAKVKLVLVNSDDMQHNLVGTLPNSADIVGKQALSLGLDGTAKNWVPDLEQVLFHTKVVQPGTEESIYFVAPSREGNYDYVCTYPGHYISMRGVMKVKK